MCIRDRNYSSSDRDSLELSVDEIKDIYEKDYNHSSTISKEHCLDTLCMTDAKISYEYKAYRVVTATLTNRSKDSIGPGFINVNFLVDEDVEVLSFYYPLLPRYECKRAGKSVCKLIVTLSSSYKCRISDE